MTVSQTPGLRATLLSVGLLVLTLPGMGALAQYSALPAQSLQHVQRIAEKLIGRFSDLPPDSSAGAEGVILHVKEPAGVARQDEIVRSGAPVPRAWNLLHTDCLTLVDSAGQPVPVEFRITARWNAGLAKATAPVQWLLVTFPATVDADGTASYRLIADGSAGPNPAPAVPLQLTRNDDQITVDTGTTVFTLGGEASALFDAIRLPAGVQVAGAALLSTTVDGAATQHAAPRRIPYHAGIVFKYTKE